MVVVHCLADEVFHPRSLASFTGKLIVRATPITGDRL
jgi:hypothetical protein